MLPVRSLHCGWPRRRPQQDFGSEQRRGDVVIAPTNGRLHQVPRRPEQIQCSGKRLRQEFLDRLSYHRAGFLGGSATLEQIAHFAQQSHLLGSQLQLRDQLIQDFRMLVFGLGGSDLLRNVFVDHVGTMDPAGHHQRNGMHFQIEDLSILAPPPGRRTQGFSGNDLLDRESGSAPGFIGHEYGREITAGKLSLSKAKQPIERSIRRLDTAFLVQDNDSERTIVDQRIQMDGLFLQVNGNAVPLTHGRSNNQSNSGNHQHEKADLGRNARYRRKNVQGDHDTEIEGEHSRDHPPNSLPHSNPDDGDKAQEKLLARTQSWSEHHPQSRHHQGSLPHAFR